MKTKTTVTHDFKFTEGIGGGGERQYLLMLNGGICYGYPKDKFTYDTALENATAEVDLTKAYYGHSPLAKKKVKFEIEPAFDFWKENKVTEHYKLMKSELIEKFTAYLKTKEQSWLEYYPTLQVIFAFIGEKEGLNSVHEKEQNEALELALKPTFLDIVYPKKVTA